MQILHDLVVYGLVARFLVEDAEQFGVVALFFVRGAQVDPGDASQRRWNAFSASFTDLVPSLIHVVVPFLKHFKPFLLSPFVHLQIASR